MNWFKEMLSGSDGITSSKRVVMFLFTLTFIGLTIANFCTGKNFDATLKDQLFYLLVWLISMVFGEQIADIFKKKDKPPTP
jgi:hypothetical protein